MIEDNTIASWEKKITNDYALLEPRRREINMKISSAVIGLSAGSALVQLFSRNATIHKFSLLIACGLFIIAVINLCIIYSRKKNIHLQMFYDDMVKEAKFSDINAIIDSYFPFMINCATTMKREDTLLWSNMICSYFQEKKITLSHNDFCNILGIIICDPIVNDALKELYPNPIYPININYGRDGNALRKLRSNYPDNTNIIRWPQFYGWSSAKYACTTITKLRSQAVYDRLDGMSVPERVSNPNYVLDSQFLLPSLKRMRRLSKEEVVYYSATVRVREIISDYISQIKTPQPCIYPVTGTNRYASLASNDALLKCANN